jgi:hypothetical protein
LDRTRTIFPLDIYQVFARGEKNKKQKKIKLSHNQITSFKISLKNHLEQLGMKTESPTIGQNDLVHKSKLGIPTALASIFPEKY